LRSVMVRSARVITPGLTSGTRSCPSAGFTWLRTTEPGQLEFERSFGSGACRRSPRNESDASVEVSKLDASLHLAARGRHEQDLAESSRGQWWTSHMASFRHPFWMTKR
jgi:hypothetical protein